MEIRRWYALIELLSSSIWNESAVRQSQAGVVINQFTALAKDPSKIAVANSRRPEAAPGLMVLTRIFFGPSSRDSTTVMASTAALVPE
jgi:hypothetical protein